jgi:threonine dehydratase
LTAVLVTRSAIVEAAARLDGVIRAMPVEHSDNLSRLAGRPVSIKPEHRQRTGSFKIRGAYNRISRLPAGSVVVAASAGNHAQGVALAAALCGLRSRIYMPVNATIPKVAATRDYGAEVCLEGADVDEALALAAAWAGETGAVFVPPFDDPLVIAGQGTIGLELAREIAGPATVLVPVGGGGVIAGIAAGLAERADVRVMGVEAVGAATMRAALDAGGPVRLDSVATMADGTAVRTVSPLTFEHAVALVSEVATVGEEEISQAVLILLERLKSVVEPAGALGLAAVLAGRVPGDGPVVCVCTGGNVDPLLLIRLVEHGLAAAGRYLRLRLIVTDRPGGLAGLLATVAAAGANVVQVSHHRAGSGLELNEVEVLLTLETRSEAHGASVVAALAAAGFGPEPVG